MVSSMHTTIHLSAMHAPPSLRVQVGMVLDLTNSGRYYRFLEEVPDADQRQIIYCKVRSHCVSSHGPASL